MVNLINTTMMYLKQLYLAILKKKNYDIHKLINIAKYGKQDLAHTLQKFTLDKIKEHIYPLKTCDNLCIVMLHITDI